MGRCREGAVRLLCGISAFCNLIWLAVTRNRGKKKFFAPVTRNVTSCWVSGRRPLMRQGDVARSGASIIWLRRLSGYVSAPMKRPLLTPDIVAYVVVYVDDILVFSNDASWSSAFKSALASRFDIKDLV